MLKLFHQAGYEAVDFKDKADVYVINTCTVTNATVFINILSIYISSKLFYKSFHKSNSFLSINLNIDYTDMFQYN